MDSQVKGGKHDSIETKLISGESEIMFEKIKEIFFDINNWDQIFASATTFQVTDEFGLNKFNQIQIGDLVKIRIPGPKSNIGLGYDWVKIYEIISRIEGDFSSHCIVLTPCSRPGSTGKTAHFFTPCAKNYFFITKSPHTITAEVHGRNEVANYASLNLRDRIRNFLVANGGLIGFGKIHWEIWSKNILQGEYLNKL